MTRQFPRGTWPPGRSRAATADPAAVARILARDLPANVTAADRAAALTAADRWGRSARDIAVMIGCSTRTVHRHRAARRKATASTSSPKEQP